MAQTRKKRRSKHRGTQAGTIETPGRTSRPVSSNRSPAASKASARQRRENRFDKEPTWRSALNRAAFAAVILAIFIGVTQKNIAQGVILGLVAMVIYVPMSYYTDRLLWRRRQRQKRQGSR
jgi:ABC-type xylose transport system permease subunit